MVCESYSGYSSGLEMKSVVPMSTVMSKTEDASGRFFSGSERSQVFGQAERVGRGTVVRVFHTRERSGEVLLVAEGRLFRAGSGEDERVKVGAWEELGCNAQINLDGTTLVEGWVFRDGDDVRFEAKDQDLYAWFYARLRFKRSI